MSKYIVIGGVAGGTGAATRLRRLIGEGEIIVLERSGYVSFANCGLPYYVGDVIKEEEKLVVQTPTQLKQRYGLDVRVHTEATRIDTANKVVYIKNLETGEEYTETYDKLLLSQGANPAKPPIPGIDLPGVHTLRFVEDVQVLRALADSDDVRSVLVVGGGFIGIELAENYTHRGKEVHLAEFSDQVMPPIDYEMACILHREMREHGIDLNLSCGLTAIEEADSKLKATLSNGKELLVDKIVISIGTRPDVSMAKEAGLEIGETGGVLVDEYMQTSDPDVYAVGDMVQIKNHVSDTVGVSALAGPANKQGRIAAGNMAGQKVAYKGIQGTSVLKVFKLNAGCTGLNEKFLKAAGMEYEKVYCSPWDHAEYYPGARHLMMKLLFNPSTGKVYGAQAVGMDGVDKRIDVIATAIKFGATVWDLQELELGYGPPFSTAKDPVNYLGFVAGNVISGQTHIFHWHDVEALGDDFPFIADVRTDMDFFMGAIPDSMNISLNVLRDRIDEFPDDEPVYLVCREGLRGYIAECALREHGITDVKNLSGGYELWSAVNSEKKYK